MEVTQNLFSSIISAGPLAVAATVVGIVVLSKLSRLADIYLDRMANKQVEC
jgi:hypothetical protein